MGQIYLPGLNWVLLAATIAIVLIFRSSDRLAAAFGLAVSATMTITTVLFAAVARVRWRWATWKVTAVAGVFLVADVSFVIANTFKFMDGGWLPLVIGAAVFILMSTWMMGRRLLSIATRDRGLPVPDFLASLELNPPHRVRGIGVFLAEEPNHVPLVLLHHLKHNQVLHETVVLLTIITEDVPRVPALERIQVNELALGFHTVVARYGFMEEPDVPDLMSKTAEECAAGGHTTLKRELNRTTYYLGRVTVVPPSKGDARQMTRWRVKLFRLLKQNERSASLYFGIPANRVVELGTRVEL